MRRDKNKLLTTEELADYFDVPVKTIYQWRLAGKGPRAARVGRHLRYDEADVAAWLEEQKQASAAR